MRRHSGWLEFWIALSAAIALISTGAVIFYALGRLSNEVNNTDLALTSQSAKAALAAFETRLRENLQDYMRWDDAALKLYGTADPEFINDMMKDVSEDGVVFDTAFLIDENGNDLAGYKNGRVLEVDSKRFFGSSLTALMQMLGPHRSKYEMTSGLLLTPAGIAAAALGVVVPRSDEIRTPARERRVLLVAKHLTSANVERLGTEFVIPGLNLLNGSTAAKGAVLLVDPRKRVIGSLGWTKRSPGSAALNEISPAVWLILALLSAVTCGIIAFACINVRYAYTNRLRAEHAARHDLLTGLPNRTALRAIFEEKGNEGVLHTHYTAVVFFDLDGFKQVNDAYGHDIGDRLLKACAAGFSYITGGTGTLGRVGGDEFAVLINGTNAHSEAEVLAEKFIAFLREPFTFDGHKIKVSTSVGISCGHARQVMIEELLRRADIAMFQAKKDGGNRVASYDAIIDMRLKEKVELAAALRDALNSGQITVAYQVVVDAQTWQPWGVEALARWSLQDGSSISPEVFIPLAEESGLIDALSTRVLRQACKEAVNWDKLVLCVNVSPVQFHNPHFDEIVAKVSEDIGFSPRRLDLELTERHLLSDPEQAFATMSRLRSRGISVSLDDFGTGYSSIGYLKRFKFDRLKLDQSICAEVLKDVNAQQMIQGTIAIAKSLGLEVTAEGVENTHQAQFLRLAGCRLLQGFCFGQPMSAEGVQQMLAGATAHERRAIA
jgi:diguanylate cyclase (GGDEF)-like protein